jgi:hypothetical protein
MQGTSKTAFAFVLFLSLGCGLFAAPIHDAAQAGDLAKITSLLAANPALVNAKAPNSATPLMYAVHSGKTEAAKLLVQKGADVNITNSDGETALFEAAAFDNVDLTWRRRHRRLLRVDCRSTEPALAAEARCHRAGIYAD